MPVQIDSKPTPGSAHADGGQLYEHPDQGVICEVCQATVAGDSARVVRVGERPPHPPMMLVCSEECAQVAA
jgi:hypothetical protein